MASTLHAETKADGWYGELSLNPILDNISVLENQKKIITNWGVEDTAFYDYENNTTFAVFSKSEVQQMINCLIWALTGCEGYFDQNLYLCGENHFRE